MLNGLRIRYTSKIDSQLKEIVIEFGKWFREKMSFPIRLTVYVRDSYRSKNNSNETFVASFFAPDSKMDNPFIRIDIQNHWNENMNINEFRQSILISIAHEISHYIQWINELPFFEEEAELKAEQLVEEFLDSRVYNLTVTPNSKKLVDLADYKSSCENFEEAVLLYNEAVKMGSDDEVIYNSIGYCLDCMEKYEDALYYYNKALELNSNHPSVYMNKGYCLFCLNQYYEAIENLRKSIEIEQSKEAYVFMANAEEKLGHYEKAMECYNKAINLDLNYDIAYNQKGQLLYNMGDFKEAREAFEKAISLNSNYAEAYYNLSLACVKLGEFTVSIDHLNVAIDLDEQYKLIAQKEDSFTEYIKTIL